MTAFTIRQAAARNWLNRLFGAFPLSAIASATLLAVGWAQDAPAQPRGTEAQQADCMPDVFRLCPSHIPDEEAILACLHRKADRLSAPCREVIDPRKQVEIKK
ncbi:hypothetical protein [Lichenihabitans psoromatis]|uniref:hypothetical protein n=1 Tax=Lichenihabitans psoromatis TaxID=2528642 RepID=UPI00103620C0|nr:hypothetical protein [Lichenihabitans psoromatis]